MQSYHDFTVGGSLGVNVHGRTLREGALIETIKSIKIMLANGSVVTASRDENYDLFGAAIGGYGAIGIIVEATLLLTDNSTIEQEEVVMSLEQYGSYFLHMIRENANVVFHNANLCIDTFNRVSSITWYAVDKECTIPDRLKDNGFFTFEYFGFQIARYLKGVQKIRLPLQMIKGQKKEIVHRNYEMSTSVATVEPLTRNISTTVLQEYFIPCEKLNEFVIGLKNIVQKYKINMLNISIRYVHQDKESIMAYAQSAESFSLVCYINMMNNSFGIKKAKKWTQELIDHVLNCGGTYYLPYQLHATKEQFEKAYPRYKELIEIKNRVDPYGQFRNTFLEKYIL